MKKLTISRGKEKYEIQMDSYKWICGSNLKMKFELVRTLQQIYQGIKPSEYAEENGLLPIISLDGRKLSSKDFLFYRVNCNYSLSSDLKLTAKSLALKYYETLFSLPEYKDTIDTFNILYEAFTDEIVANSPLTGRFNAMTPKFLAKLISPFYLPGESVMNEFDLSSDEIIELQLNMIHFISKNDCTIPLIIIVVEMDEVSEHILHLINQLPNVLSLMMVQQPISFDKDLSKYYLCERYALDLANENDFYYLICDNQFKLLSVKEGYDYMEKYLFNKEHEVAGLIEKLLK